MVKESEIIIKENGKEIYAKLYMPKEEGTYPVIILSHGYNGCNADFIRECNYYADNGYIVCAYDFCGGSTRSKSRGNSTDMTIFTEKEDLLTVFNCIKKMDNVDKKNIFLFGASQGGFVTALTAEALKDELKGMALYFPAFNIPDDWRRKYYSTENIPDIIDFWGLKLGKNFAVSIREFNTYDNIGTLDKNVLIIHGDNDNIVSMNTVTNAQKHYKNARLVVLEGEGHGFSEQGAKTAMELVLDYMNTNRKDI